MSVLKRSEAKKPLQRRKTVTVEAIGGDVILQALGMSDKLILSMIRVPHREDASEEEIKSARAQTYSRRMKYTLHVGVLDADLMPVWDEAVWDAFGSDDENVPVAMDLFNQIGALSVAEKKNSPQTSDSPSESVA